MGTMEGIETSPTVRNQDEFLKGFIKAYQNEPILWDKKHPKYKSRQDRDEAMHALLEKCIEYFPEADQDFVKTKIDNMRCVFRRERKKVLESKKNAKDEDDVYSPNLWYYYHLLFLVGEEVDEEEKEHREGKGRMYTWSKRDTTILIDLLKKYPDAYSSEYTGRVQRMKRTKAFKEIWEELKQQGINHFDISEVKNKVTTLRSQYRRECRDRDKNKGIKHVSRLWCYDLLLFLKDSWGTKKEEKDPDFPDDDQDMSDDDQYNDTNDDTGNSEPLWLKCDNEATTGKKEKEEPMSPKDQQDDYFDTVGRNIAMKLRDMNPEQRIFAENLINEVVYNGLMENLNANYRISCI